mmetsp:Transcript_82102/g.211567  ORF Transcript_82102/g.211567 Transcript_82102/m.211567 type:complete len:228 (-) Transcript_82102:655-1338(-)
MSSCGAPPFAAPASAGRGPSSSDVATTSPSSVLGCSCGFGRHSSGSIISPSATVMKLSRSSPGPGTSGMPSASTRGGGGAPLPAGKSGVIWYSTKYASSLMRWISVAGYGSEKGGLLKSYGVSSRWLSMRFSQPVLSDEVVTCVSRNLGRVQTTRFSASTASGRTIWLNTSLASTRSQPCGMISMPFVLERSVCAKCIFGYRRMLNARQKGSMSTPTYVTFGWSFRK